MWPGSDVPAPLVVLGPTASGKSDVAMAFAAAECPRVEIIAVDAMQVYRGMDIGTAKPTAADRRRIRHHCLDLVEPTHDFAVTEFVRAADAAITDIAGRGAAPLLVAGTGLYLRALTDPMEIPGTWPEVRSELERRAAVEGSQRLHAELSASDRVAASRIEPGNVRRLVRALEVVIGSGRPFSSFGPGIGTYGETPFRMVGLRWDRDELLARITRRVHRMLADGFLAEVSELRDAAGGAHAGLSRTARQALGYRELLDHLDGRCSLAEATDAIVTRTRRFAVRQERWFRRDPRVVWVDVVTDPVSEAVPVLRDLSRR
jgi:tRNA dimethylallyltransferase